MGRVTAVRILGREYRIRNAGDPEHAHAVAAYVDQTLREIQASLPDTQDAPILAALNIANELLTLRACGQSAISQSRIRAMIDLIESV